jgi:outer membrane receptor protein involved in Fe transport
MWKIPLTPKMMRVLAIAVALALAARAGADTLTDVVVTATRIAEPIDRVPVDISVVDARELAARGATDLAGALSLVSGVEAPSGGDAGPSSAVPAFWGLHEFDAFLLVVDGVPWGGAFNPSITTLDFTDVQRVEVLKGSAPVTYGATSFVGVVQAIHYPAGTASNTAEFAGGTYGSLRGSAALALPDAGDYRQSLAVAGQRLGFADARERVENGRALYRGALDVGGGTLRIDADLTAVRNRPTSPVLRSGSGLTAVTPLDANFNPSDARIDQDQFHLSVGYSYPTALGEWESLVSFAHSDITDVRAFLHPDLSGSADTQSQRRTIDDGYLDSQLTHRFSTETTLIVGADLLYGRGRQTTRNGNDAYTVPLDGSVLPPSAASVPVTEIGTLDDSRWFAGQYAQLDWKPDERWDLAAGVRMNETSEHKNSSDQVLAPPPSSVDAETRNKTQLRPTETLGASYRAWQAGPDELVVYADYRNAFKSAAIDFGPDFRPELLSTETAQSYEAGLKGIAGGGRLRYQAELFLLDFHNLVVATPAGSLANAAGQRLKGLEAEAGVALAPDLDVMLSASYHEATYTHYLFFDGTGTVDVAGRQLPLSPHVLAAAGLLYQPQAGFTASVVGRYVGRRYLDEENTAPVGGYATLDASIGWSRDGWRASVDGTNLGNQRPPVTSSEFGSQSFYLLPARMLWARIGYHWR